MRYLTYDSNANPSVAILLKNAAHEHSQVNREYILPLKERGVTPTQLLSLPLPYDKDKRVSAGTKKAFLTDLAGYLEMWGITTLYVADAEYFKTICKVTKTDASLGYVKKGIFPGYESINIVLGVNYQASLYNPLANERLERSLDTLAQHMLGHQPQDYNIIHDGYYPHTVEDIARALNGIRDTKAAITVDIETNSLNFWEAGLESIAIAWDQHSGIAFPIDRHNSSKVIRHVLRTFFMDYEGQVIYHNANYDVKVLVYELFMKNLTDYEGMNEGIKILTRKIEDTKIIAYLALNSTSEVKLGLKNLAGEYTGDYALDDEEIRCVKDVHISDLLTYNLTDALATWYVFNKYFPIMKNDDQLVVYYSIMRPSVITLIKTELVGLPISPDKVKEADDELNTVVEQSMDVINNNPDVQDFWQKYLEEMAEADNNKRKEKSKTGKIKLKTAADFSKLKFNPGSSLQLQKLLYGYLNLPIIDKTKKGAPAVGGKTLEKLVNHCKTSDDKQLLEMLVILSKASKIISDFIPTFKGAVKVAPNQYRLYGNFNLGGTQAGRLSSSNPNLQNIPSGSTYAKIIKQCFTSDSEWLFVGADFNALEAKIGALLSRDPNKLAIYIDGYDSHCFNTYQYFKTQMPDIVDTVQSINSIEKKYSKLRSKSKAPTFALDYFGTFRTIMNSTGLPEREAKAIEKKYRDTYQVALQWINGVLDQAHEDGYLTLAFGLRLRTPALAITLNTSKMPYTAVKERRSAGNAKTQSYGLLNSRAANEFNTRIHGARYENDVLPCAQIHDALYYLVRNDAKIITWVNQNLIECMEFQDLPELKHDIVKLGGELDIYYPNWNTPLTLPNAVTKEQIKQLAAKHAEKK